MHRPDRSVMPSRAAVGLILGTWLLFFALLGVMSGLLAPRPLPLSSWIRGGDVTAALTWTVLTIAIVAWHQLWRRRTTSTITLVAVHVPLLCAAAISDTIMTRWATSFFDHAPPPMSFSAMIVFYLDFDLVTYAAIIALTEVALLRRAIDAGRRRAERLESSLARARLDYLEAQLQPHFLFNSLGAVSELAYDSPESATRVLRQLTSIFRTALSRKSDEITLREELIEIEPYLEIQRIRFADWLTIDYRVDAAAAECFVPRFVLQPLIENAIRHGLSGRDAAGVIEIATSRTADALVVRVVDNGVGLHSTTTSAGRGIGLSNVRDRLRILYGSDDALQLSAGPNGGTIAELRVPARLQPSSTDAAAEPVDETERPLGERLPIQLPTILRRPGVAILVFWLASGLVWTQQSYLYLLLRNRLNGATWLSIALNDFISAALWAALTPLLLRFASRFPLRRAGIAWRATAYGIVGVAAVLLHTEVWRLVSRQTLPLFSATYEMSYIVGSILVAALLAAGHRARLFEWLRATEAAADGLDLEVQSARSRAAQLQHIPGVLLEALERTSALMAKDVTLAERQLVGLADYVRLALECTDERGVTSERAAALTASLGRIRDGAAIPLSLTA